ncbi:Hypothetical predicted protein, partial [Paramuricea clavata]
SILHTPYNIKIRLVAKVLGHLISSLPAVMFVAKGWGAALGEQSTGGPTEAELHINALEQQAAFFALRSFKHSLSADKESRRSYSDSEWMIDSNIMQKSLSDLDFTPEIDLFASRLNNQLNAYCSYRPDPDAMYINAFSISWANLKFYSFPPFSCILQVVQKIIQDKAAGVIVVPNWPTQAWYSLLQPLLVKSPQTCKPSKTLLHLPACQTQSHPLHKKLELHICLEMVRLLYEASSFDGGLSYASVNTACSALSYVLLIENSKIPFGQLPPVKHFVKGIFELKPSLPRYRTVWNVSTVFNYPRCQPNIADLSLKDLSLRLTLLLLLLSGQHCQTVYYFTMDNMELSEDKCVFKVTDKVKPGKDIIFHPSSMSIIPMKE